MRILFAALVLAIAACASVQEAPSIAPAGPAIVRNSPTSGADVQAAAYVRVSNAATRADRLVRITCECADVVEIHNTPANAEMHSIPHLDIPPGGTLEIYPGGPTHLMLIGVRAPIAPSQRVPMTLHFANSAPLTLEFEAVENSREGWAARLAL